MTSTSKLKKHISFHGLRALHHRIEDHYSPIVERLSLLGSVPSLQPHLYLNLGISHFATCGLKVTTDEGECGY